MNPGRYFMPNMAMNQMAFGNNYGLSRGLGSLERIVQSVKSFNWGKLLNGANKTLNVMNQTIPLIRQAKPMVNNVKSMFKIVRAFGSETVIKQSTKISNPVDNRHNTLENRTFTNKKEANDDNYPNFFI